MLNRTCKKRFFRRIFTKLKGNGIDRITRAGRFQELSPRVRQHYMRKSSHIGVSTRMLKNKSIFLNQNINFVLLFIFLLFKLIKSLNSKSNFSLKFVDYSQSSRCKTRRDSSVSYASASLVSTLASQSAESHSRSLSLL